MDQVVTRNQIVSGSFFPEVIAKPERRVKVVSRDQPIIQQVSQFSNPSGLLSFLKTVDTNELDHKDIEVISDVLWETLKNEPLVLTMKNTTEDISKVIYAVLLVAGTKAGRSC